MSLNVGFVSVLSDWFLLLAWLLIDGFNSSWTTHLNLWCWNNLIHFNFSNFLKWLSQVDHETVVITELPWGEFVIYGGKQFYYIRYIQRLWVTLHHGI